MSKTPTVAELEERLNSFDPHKRATALAALVSQSGKTAPRAEAERVNMHCHTFFSFNSLGLSPAGLAWMARKNEIDLLGIVDFDVLDGVEEFMQDCQTACVRGSAAMETRVFIPEFADREINSPGEPGIYYYMGIGFTHSQAPGKAGQIQDKLRRLAAQRNRAMTERVNAFLDPVRIDYDLDVLPITPSGNATERHMLRAYDQAARQKFADPAPFWANKLGMDEAKVRELMGSQADFHNILRARLMKRGGVGYVQPDGASFPTVEEVNEMIVACGALPCATWLDGFSAGERDLGELLDLLIAKGAVALNIVPDRNWNIKDPDLRRQKVEKLHQAVELAKAKDLPLNIGTELNAPGQKLFDELDVAELAPVREAFIAGAWFIYGHTMLELAEKRGYQSQWAQKWLPQRAERNRFYEQLGRQTPPGRKGLEKLRQAGFQARPDDYLKRS